MVSPEASIASGNLRRPNTSVKGEEDFSDFHENHIHYVNILTCEMFYRAAFGTKK